MSSRINVSLLPHSDTPCPAVRDLQVRVSGQTDRALILSFELRGDLSRLRIPAPAAPTSADGLWEHTCFELFIARAGQSAYREYNFSPSGQWAGYAFRAYRERDEGLALPAPRLRLTRHVDCFALEVMLPLGALQRSPAGHPEPLQCGLSAVIEDADGTRSYWALCHPAARPDFHHRESFALSLGTPA